MRYIKYQKSMQPGIFFPLDIFFLCGGRPKGSNIPIIPPLKTCCQEMKMSLITKEIDAAEITCSICYKIYNTPRILKCKHVFCQECIVQWGDKRQNCPYCRTSIKRSRGNYGRAHKTLSKRIQRVKLLCKNCDWKGSTIEFLSEFCHTPFLVQDYQVKQIKDQQCKQNIEEQKRQSPSQIIQKEKCENNQNGQNQDVQKSQRRQSFCIDDFLELGDGRTLKECSGRKRAREDKYL